MSGSACAHVTRNPHWGGGSSLSSHKEVCVAQTKALCRLVTFMEALIQFNQITNHSYFPQMDVRGKKEETTRVC